jgi:enoyl-CoA hydratase/carnithine racemase
VDARAEVRVLVLRGAGGRAFVAGTDIGQFREFAGGTDGIAYERRVERVLARLEAVRVPTVAVVEGYAVGGGMALAAACDLRLATPDAQFGVPVARTLGNCLSMENYARLVALLGAARTLDLVLTASWLTAADARAAGFVTAVVETGELDAAVADLCATLARHAPLTMWATRQAVHRLRRPVKGDDLIAAVYGSRDFRHGVAAFLDKRPPEWEGA